MTWFAKCAGTCHIIATDERDLACRKDRRHDENGARDEDAMFGWHRAVSHWGWVGEGNEAASKLV
jgi:hypothetical protein